MTGIGLAAISGFAAGISRHVAPAVDAGATDGSRRSEVRAALRAAGTAVHDAVTAASRTATTATPLDAAVTERVAAAVANLNRALGALASGNLSADFQVSVANAVREAVGGLSNANGLTLSRTSGGAEKLVVDTAALAEALASDPQALDALVVGPAGLPEAFSVALTDEALATAAATASSPLADGGRQVADIVRAAGVTLTRSIQLVGSLQAASLTRLDLLV